LSLIEKFPFDRNVAHDIAVVFKHGK